MKTKTLFIYSVYHQRTGKFLGLVKLPTLEECRKWKKSLATALKIPESKVYGRYHKIQII